MTDQKTNGPVGEAATEATALERGAELSAQIVRAQPSAQATPERTAAELRARLELLREVKRTAMTEAIDYGVVPGTDKPGLFKPGAEKLALVFKLDVQSSNEPIWGPGEHLTVISRATVFHAPTGTRLGYGEGICSSRESKYAYRNAGVKCPECGKETVRKSRPRPDGTGGKGWYCWAKPEKGNDGCGAQFPDDDDPRLVGQKVGRIENPDLPDTWNAVDKMAAKRCLGGTTPLVYATNSGISRGNIHQLERVLKQAANQPVWLPGADGSWRRVLGIAKVPRDDVVRVSLADGTVLRVTPEHRFPTARGLVAVSELHEADLLRRGIISQESPGRCSAALDEYGWLAGLFLAEGHHSRETGAIRFTLHAEEEVFVERITTVASSLGAPTSVRPHGPNCQVVQVSAASFAGVIDRFVTGTSCYDKHLSRHAWRQGPSFLHELLVGYLEGDGHLHTKPGTRQQKWTIGFTGKNAALADDLRALCAMLGYRISLRRSDARAAGVTYPTYSGWISFSKPQDNGALLEKVVGIEPEAKRQGSVMYDIEVDGDHLFCLGTGIITHNSRVDAVLSVTGASAIFTQDIGADPTETGADPGPEHGPVVAGELKQAATQAAIRLCAGDLDEAKALWQRIQARLDGYMPEAAAAVLVIAAETAGMPSPENHGPAEEKIAGANGTQPAEPPASGPGTGEQTVPAAGGDTPPPASAAGASQPAPPLRAAQQPEPNSHGAQLHAIAAGRGVSDAELANLIRNAVAQGPIPAERARTALPEMLARITEEIAARTIELVEMFYPPANTPTDGAAADTTSVDFGAVEPPRAA